MKKIFLYLAGFLTLVVLVLVFFPWDDRRVNDDDLELAAPVVIPDAENMHQLLAKFKVEMLAENVKALLPHKEEIPSQSVIIETRPLAQDLTNTILSQERFECDLDLAPKCELTLIRGIGNFLLAHTEQYALASEIGNAGRTYEAAVKLATAMANQKSPVTLIELMISISILAQAEQVADKNILADIFLGEIKQKYGLSKDSLVSTLKAEYQHYKIRSFFENSLALKVRYLYQPNKTLNYRADFTRNQLILANSECGTPEAQRVIADLDKRVTTYPYPLAGFISFIAPNLLGRMEIYTTVRSIVGVYGKYCEAKNFFD